MAPLPIILRKENLMDEQNAVSAVGDAVGTVVDEVVPQTVLERIHAFSETWLGGIVVTAAFIAIVVLLAAIVVRLVNRFFRRTVQRMLEAGNPAATAFSYLRYFALAAIYFTAFAVIVSNIPPLAAGMNKLFAAGGVLFIISDNILCAYSFGSERRFGANIGIHATYYAAQLLIAWSVFFM